MLLFNFLIGCFLFRRIILLSDNNDWILIFVISISWTEGMSIGNPLLGGKMGSTAWNLHLSLNVRVTGHFIYRPVLYYTIIVIDADVRYFIFEVGSFACSKIFHIIKY